MKEQLASDGSPVGIKQAFQDWLAASDAWLKLYRQVPTDGEGADAAQQRLRELERRVEAAADAFEQLHPLQTDLPRR